MSADHEHLTDEALFEYYNQKAGALDELAITYEHKNPYKRFFYHARYNAVLRALDPQPGERILDIGCGTGYYVAGVVKAGALVSGVDLASNYVRQAADHVSRVAPDQAAPLMAAAEAKHLPFDDATFDKVLMTEVLEHLIDYPVALDEISRVLRPGGMAVITTPSRYSPLNLAFHWKAHRRKYGFHEHIVELTPRQFRKAMRKHFRGVQIRFANFLFPYPLDVLAENTVPVRAATALGWAERALQSLPIIQQAGWTMIATARKSAT